MMVTFVVVGKCRICSNTFLSYFTTRNSTSSSSPSRQSSVRKTRRTSYHNNSTAENPVGLSPPTFSIFVPIPFSILLLLWLPFMCFADSLVCPFK